MKQSSTPARRAASRFTFVEALEARQFLAAHPLKATPVVKKPVKPAVVVTPKVTTIVGNVFVDNRSDGSYDASDDDAYQSGVTVYLDYNGSGTLTAGEPSYVTAADGQFQLISTVPGALIREIVPAGYVSTTGGIAGITGNGTIQSGLKIGNFNTTIQLTTLNNSWGVVLDNTRTYLDITGVFSSNLTAYRVPQSLITTLTINGTSQGENLFLSYGSNSPDHPINVVFNAGGGTDLMGMYAGFSNTTATYTGNGTFAVGNFTFTSTNNERTGYSGSSKNDTINLIGTTGFRFVGNGGSDTINLTGADWTPEFGLYQGDNGDQFTKNVTIAGVSGTNSVYFRYDDYLKALNLTGGNTAVTMADGVVLRTTALSINTTSSLDLGTGGVIVDYDVTAASPLASIAALVKRGYNNGGQNGSGIRSIVATRGQNRRVGYAEASNVLTYNGNVDPTASFYGRFGVDPTAVVLRYTLAGDADLDGGLSINDFNRLATHFATLGTYWQDGDFDYDGGVSINDFNLLAADFGQTV